MARRVGGQRRLNMGAQLHSHVITKLRQARDAWAPEYRRMVTCARLMRGMPYDDEDCEDMPGLTYPVVPAIAKAIRAVLVDIFGSSISAPFSLEPDAIPDLPPDVTAWLRNLVQQNLPALEAVTGGDPSLVPEALSGLHETVLQEMNDKAQDAASNLTNVVKTRLQEGHWRSEFSDFMTNLVCYPVAILKGPILRTEKVRRWNTLSNMLSFEDDDVWVVENVNPFSFYPSPLAKDAQSAEYVIEVRRTTALEFGLLARTEGYDPQAVQQTQQDYPDGHLQPFFNGDERDPDRDLLQMGTTNDLQTAGYYDVVCFYGRISGSYLNVIGGYDLNDWEWYEAEVEVCGDEVIRAAINPRPDNRRPFNVLSFETVPGSLFGECVPTRLLDVQRACESAIRTLLRNMAFAAGPLGEVNTDKLADDEDPFVIEPLGIKLTKPGLPGDNAPAYTFHDVPSHSQELMAIFDKFLSLGYDILGFPRMSLGGMPDPSVGRTSGGMSMVLNQASKPLKQIISDIGDNIITPTVQSYVDLELMVSTDPAIRGDIHVHAKGIEGLADDEAKAQRILMALQNIAGLSQILMEQSPIQPVITNLLYRWMKLEGLSTEGMPNLQENSAFAQDTGAAYTPGNGQAMGQPNDPAPPVQPLDGRSPNAVGAIQQSNNMASTMGGR